MALRFLPLKAAPLRCGPSPGLRAPALPSGLFPRCRAVPASCCQCGLQSPGVPWTLQVLRRSPPASTSSLTPRCWPWRASGCLGQAAGRRAVREAPR